MGRCMPITLLVLALSALSLSASGQEPTSQPAAGHAAIDDAIRVVLEEYRETAEIPGATVGYVLPDGTAGSVSVGFADVENEVPMTGDHRMLAGSVGKVFFATLALMLVEDGVLDLDMKISEQLGDEPWFNRLPNAHDITVRMLMNHSSGIPRHVMKPAFLARVRAEPLRAWSGAELVQFVLDDAALFPAGEGFSYADTNFVVMATVVEQITGRTCYEQIRERVLKPNKLVESIPSNTPDLPNLANGYIVENRNLLGLERSSVVQDGSMVFNPQFEWAGGGYASTPTGLARFARLCYGGDLLKPATKAMMFDAIDADLLEPGERYGLGVMIRDSRHGPAQGHTGYFPGYLTEMAYFADHDIAVAIQVNSTQLGPAHNYGTLRRALDACAAGVIEALGDG